VRRWEKTNGPKVVGRRPSVAATYHRKITDIFWVVAGKTARAAFWSAPAKKWVEMPTLAEGQDA